MYGTGDCMHPDEVRVADTSSRVLLLLHRCIPTLARALARALTTGFSPGNSAHAGIFWFHGKQNNSSQHSLSDRERSWPTNDLIAEKLDTKLPIDDRGKIAFGEGPFECSTAHRDMMTMDVCRDEGRRSGPSQQHSSVPSSQDGYYW